MTSSFEELLDSTGMIKKGDLVTGTVSKIYEDKAYIDVVGAQYDCVILKNQVSRKFVREISDVLNVGDEIEAVVTGVRVDREKKSEDVPGVIYLSRKIIENKEYKKLISVSWNDLLEKFENNELIEAKVKKTTKGGLLADVNGLTAFIPASMMSNKYVKEFSEFINNVYTFKIDALDKESSKIILNRRVILEEEEKEKLSKIYSSLNVGDVIEGTVRRITNFGVFVNIGEIDGLVHISEISHTRFNKISDVLTVGEKVKVVILELDEEKEKISLSIKALLPTQWELAKDKFKKDDVVEGIVKNITDFGAFVEISDGVEGLVHVSQISHERIKNASEVLTSGETVKAQILDIDLDNKRISLSIKKLIEKPIKEEEKEPEFDKSYLKKEDTEFSLADKFKDLK